MSTVLPIKVTVGRLPLNYSDTPKRQFRSILRRMRGKVSGVVTGQTDGSEPSSDVGLWIDSRTVFVWDKASGGYVPHELRFLNGTHVTTATTETLTDDRTQTFPLGTGAGVVAYLADIYIPRPVDLVEETGATLVVDASLFEQVYAQLHQDITITFSLVSGHGFPAGKKIVIGLLNDGTSYTVDWDAGFSIKWPGGTEPTQPVAVAGGSGLGIYTLRLINGVIYGNMRDASPADPTMLATSPAIPRNYGGAGNNPRAAVEARLP